jgi:hypothetical protein
MLPRAYLAAATALALGVIGPLACGDDPSVKLAKGNALLGESPKDIAPDSGAVATGEGGCTKPSGEGGANCPTFATMWTKYFGPQGEWACGAAGCHGAGGNEPQPLTDQATAYGVLTKYTKLKNLPYVNSGCIEEEQSPIVCNIAAKPAQCSLQGAMPQGKTASAASIADLEKWIQCGSPQ